MITSRVFVDAVLHLPAENPPTRQRHDNVYFSPPNTFRRSILMLLLLLCRPPPRGAQSASCEKGSFDDRISASRSLCFSLLSGEYAGESGSDDRFHSFSLRKRSPCISLPSGALKRINIIMLIFKNIIPAFSRSAAANSAPQ